MSRSRPRSKSLKQMDSRTRRLKKLLTEKRKREAAAKAFELQNPIEDQCNFAPIDPVTEDLERFERPREKVVDEDIQHMSTPDLLIELTDAPEDDPRAKQLRQRLQWRTWQLESTRREKHPQSWMV